MQRTERIMIYAVLAMCLVLGFRAAQSAPANAGQPTAPPHSRGTRGRGPNRR